MRSPQNRLQDVWICNYEEINVGIDRAKIFDKPVKYQFSVSATSGIVFGWGAGYSLQYDRYITNYDRDLYGVIKEGQAAFIDVEPALDENGELVVDIEYETDRETGDRILDEDDEPVIKRITYRTEPDYIIQKILDTKRGKVARYAIKKR